MNEAKARALFETACQAVGEDVPRPKNWQRLNEKTFLAVYCGVIFASNFKASIVDAKFPAMKKVFRQFQRLRDEAPKLFDFDDGDSPFYVVSVWRRAGI